MLLADEMGVGKTIQSLAIAFIYRYEWPLVVICPSTLRFNWLNEIMHWYGDYIKKSEVYVYTKGGLTLKDTTKILVISYDLAWKFK
jgi:SWI/SNF-related matrix-associated actin-dependent regulator 1 of chromatin subfamily A